MNDEHHLTCAFCGEQFPDGTPEAKNQALTDHIYQCKAHPIRTVGQALAMMAGVGWPVQDQALEELRGGISMIQKDHPDEPNIKIALAAISALRPFVQKTGEQK